MPKNSANKPSHVSTSNVFADLGFPSSEASALKFKATILSALLDRIQRKGYSQKDLVTLLNDHQPQISNLLRGKISTMSIEKLLTYADALNVHLEVRRSSTSGTCRTVA
jgi:predicted XRE-type DNA-binding protein